MSAAATDKIDKIGDLQCAEVVAFPTLEKAVRHAMRTEREDRRCGHCGRMLHDTTLVELMLHARKCRQLNEAEAAAEGAADQAVEMEALAAMLADNGSGKEGEEEKEAKPQ